MRVNRVHPGIGPRVSIVDKHGVVIARLGGKDGPGTEAGKFIAPQPIENSLRLNALIGTAVVIGDRRKFPAVIISPYFPLLDDWARANNVAFSSRQELINNVKVQGLYEGIVADANQNLARFEKLKRVLLVADEFSPENGALTPTLKLRRRVVEDRYHRLIEEMYAQAEASGVDLRVHP